MITTIRKTIRIQAAHSLPQHLGKCSQLHGHEYRIEVLARGNVNASGMVVDFGDLSRLMSEIIDVPCDHKYLNLVYPEMYTTAENLSRRWLLELWEREPLVYLVRVHETHTCYADSMILPSDDPEKLQALLFALGPKNRVQGSFEQLFTIR